MNYDSAIQKGVTDFLEANRSKIIENIQLGIERGVDDAIKYMATGVMAAVAKFLDENKEHLIAAIASAVATSWNNRHPRGETCQ